MEKNLTSKIFMMSTFNGVKNLESNNQTGSIDKTVSDLTEGLICRQQSLSLQFVIHIIFSDVKINSCTSLGQI